MKRYPVSSEETTKNKGLYHFIYQASVMGFVSELGGWLVLIVSYIVVSTMGKILIITCNNCNLKKIGVGLMMKNMYFLQWVIYCFLTRTDIDYIKKPMV